MSWVAFTPSTAITVAASTTQGTAIVPGTGHYMRLCNAGQGNAFVAFYEATATPPTLAAISSMVLPAGAIEIFAVASDTTRVAYLGDSTGTTLNITRGEGQ